MLLGVHNCAKISEQVVGVSVTASLHHDCMWV